MSYVTGRVFRDSWGFLYKEHRPGYYRRVDAPVIPNTEHLVTNSMEERMMVDPGLFIIEEIPW